MNMKAECLVCSQNLALSFASLATDDETVRRNVVFRMMDLLKNEVPANLDSFIVGLRIMEIIKEMTGCDDPCKEFKAQSTRAAKQLVPFVRSVIERSGDPLRAACQAALMSNYLDVVSRETKELEHLFDEQAFSELPFAVDHFDQLRPALSRARKIVYLSDNAGECFFDRLFIEGIRAERKDVEIDYFVKDFPFLSDAQYEDIAGARLEEVAFVKTIPLVEPVEMDQGYIFKLFKGFLEIAGQADLVIAKGQANFELLPSLMKGGFYLFMHKCPTIASMEGAQVGQAAIQRK